MRDLVNDDVRVSAGVRLGCLGVWIERRLALRDLHGQKMHSFTLPTTGVRYLLSGCGSAWKVLAFWVGHREKIPWLLFNAHWRIRYCAVRVSRFSQVFVQFRDCKEHADKETCSGADHGSSKLEILRPCIN